MVPADDQAMVFPWASVMVIIVLLKVAFTCATREAIFLRPRRRTRVASLPILDPLAARRCDRRANDWCFNHAAGRAPAKATQGARFLPAMGLAGPLRVRALVWVRWPRPGGPRRCRNPRYQPRSISRLMFMAT